MGAEYVDIEHDAVDLLPDRKDTRLIVSSHDFQAMPSDLPGLHRALAAKDADVVKVVGTARRLSDNVDVLDIFSKTTVPTIAIAMGEAGLVSRVLALRYESCLLTYCTLDTGEAVAPGQLAVETMRRVYLAGSIGPQTAVFAVLSDGPVDTALVTSLNAATRDRRSRRSLGSPASHRTTANRQPTSSQPSAASASQATPSWAPLRPPCSQRSTM